MSSPVQARVPESGRCWKYHAQVESPSLGVDLFRKAQKVTRKGASPHDRRVIYLGAGADTRFVSAAETKQDLVGKDG